MKKLIPDEKNWKNKLVKFLKNKGFYVVLAVCIIIVAATAIFVMTQNMNSPDTGISNEDMILKGETNEKQNSKAVTGNVDKPASNTSEKASAAEPNVEKKPENKNETKGETKGVTESKAKNKTENKVEKKDETKDEKKGNTESKTSAAVMKFIRPVEGSIMKDFTRDASTFSESKTMGDLRAHAGIDYKVDKLTKVRAVADGTICLVENNESGITIEISHGKSGLKTKYAGLSSQGIENISFGLKVRANDIIGQIGDPIQSELKDGAHLHFEVLKDGKSVDPEPYLKAEMSEDKKAK